MKWSRTLVAAAAAAAIFALAACSAGPSAGPSGSSSHESMQTLKLGDLALSAVSTPLYVGIQKGFFKKEGVDVEVTQFQGGVSSAIPALASGSIDAASGGLLGMISAMGNGALTGKFIGQVVDNTYDLIVGTNSGITNVKGLKGKKIGVSSLGGADQIVFQALLKKYGMTNSDVTFVPVGAVAARFNALQSGQVDATLNLSAYRATSQQFGTVLLKAESNFPVNAPSVVFYANASYIKAHGDVLTKFIKGMREATAYVRDKKNYTEVSTVCQAQTKSTADLCQQVWDWATDPQLATKWTWSDYKMDLPGFTSAINATAISTPGAAKLTAASITDQSFTK